MNTSLIGSPARRVGLALCAVAACWAVSSTTRGSLPSDVDARWAEVVALAAADTSRPAERDIAEVKAAVLGPRADAAEVARMLRGGVAFRDGGSTDAHVVASWALRDDNVDAALVDGVLRAAADLRASAESVAPFSSGCSITQRALRVAAERGLELPADVDALMPTRAEWVAAHCRDAVAWDALPANRLIAAGLVEPLRTSVAALSSTPFHRRLAERALRAHFVRTLDEIRAGRAPDPASVTHGGSSTLAALRGLLGDETFFEDHPLAEVLGATGAVERQLAQLERGGV